MGRLAAWGLLSPALLLVAAAFLLPLLYLLSLAVHSPELPTTLPRTTALLQAWDGANLPPEPVFAAMAQELAQAEADQVIGQAASRLNFEEVGMRTLLLRTARAGPRLQPPYQPAMAALDPRWASPATWHLIQAAARPATPSYLLRALDLKQTPEGDIQRVSPESAVFVDLFRRTFSISAWVTAICLLLAYPVAYTLSTLSRRWASIGMLFVLVPFWTSILVRSIAWFILLQREGPLNALLLALGIVDKPLTLIFTRFAVYLAMVHVLLPFAVMPLYSVMKGVDRTYLRAAASLGAPPWRSFLRIYLPLTMPGVLAGGLMVFMLSVGFYITPSMVGGPNDQMVSAFIAFFTNTSINWGMASALAALLLLFTGALVAIAHRATPGAAPIR